MVDLKTAIERDVLPFVEKPLRYVGNELNIIRKDLSSVAVHGVLCFPDLYDIGMSHLGLQLLYHIVNREPAWALSRCFHPWTDAEARFRELNIPLYTLEYCTPVRDADWIGFSVQYELHVTNLLNMLDLAGLPLYSRDRGDRDPVVIAGGPCMGNPEPIADFVDACVIGDGEETVVSICRLLEKMKREKPGRPDRSELLAALDGIESIYVPSRCRTVKRGRFVVPERPDAQPVRAAKVTALQSDWYPERPLVPIIEVVHHRLAVEVMRGCTRGCRFCAAGTYYRPVRERDPEIVYRQIESDIAATGWRDIGLLSLSTADYSCLGALLDAAQELKRRYRVALSVPSTRIDALTDDQFAKLTSVSPVSSLTIAPEAGSARLRRVINKDFSDEAILSTVKTLLNHQVQTIKLYFMIGLPHERDEDIEAIAAMVEKIAGMSRAKSHRCKVNVSLSPFSPKPQTPFQWEAMESLESLDRKNLSIKTRLRYLKNVKVSYRNVSMTLLESVIARGDRSVGSLIHAAWKMGSRFDGWDDKFVFERWSTASRETGIDFADYTREIPLEQELPWSVVNTGVSREFLLAEQERSRTETVTGDCRKSGCVDCGACDGQAFVCPDTSAAATISRSNPAEAAGTVPAENTFRYRIIYSKGPSVRFLGHLDMVTVFHRALIATGFALAYSQGFQPHPRISFGPPLPFGVMGDAEAFDLVATAPVTGDVMRVNAMLPPDLRIHSVSAIPEQDVSLTASIRAGSYRFTPCEPNAAIAISQLVEIAQRKKELPVTITKNGVTKIKDLRPLIRELHCGKGERPYLDAVLALDPGATCKPSELITAFFPEQRFSDFLVVRKACLVQKNGVLVGLSGTAKEGV